MTERALKLWDTTRVLPVDARLEHCEYCGGRCIALKWRGRQCTTECRLLRADGERAQDKT